MTAVWERSPLKGGSLLLLLALADFASDEGLCWPSIETLARKCRVTERSVYENLRYLEKIGVLEIERGGGRAGTNLYRIRTDQISVLGGGGEESSGVKNPVGKVHPNRKERSEPSGEESSPPNPEPRCSLCGGKRYYLMDPEDEVAVSCPRCNYGGGEIQVEEYRQIGIVQAMPLPEGVEVRDIYKTQD